MLPEDESQYPSPEEYNQETEFTLIVTSKNAILGIFRDGNEKCDFPFPSFSITYVIKNGSMSLCCTGTSNF